MKIMFIVYHDLKIEARSQEILECAKLLGSETILVSYSKPFDTDGVKCILTGKGQRNYFNFIKMAIKAIKQEEPEIIILHDEYTATVLRWITKNRKDIFVIFDSSELYIDKKPRTFKELIARHMHYVEKKYLKYADVVISANIERGKIMKEYYKLNELPIVFDNIHKIEDYYNSRELDGVYGELFSDNKFNIVYGGGINKKRMTFELLEAISVLGDEYKLIICGLVNQRDKREFDKIILKKNISNVHYLGFLSRKEWRYMLNKASISVSAFSQDTVNNIYCASGKLYESLFEGTPILTSENPPLKRICKEFGVGVSNDNFIEGIRELKDNYTVYYENTKKIKNNINYETRIEMLASKLKDKISEDKGYSKNKMRVKK